MILAGSDWLFSNGGVSGTTCSDNDHWDEEPFHLFVSKHWKWNDKGEIRRREGRKGSLGGKGGGKEAWEEREEEREKEKEEGRKYWSQMTLIRQFWYVWYIALFHASSFWFVQYAKTGGRDSLGMRLCLWQGCFQAVTEKEYTYTPVWFPVPITMGFGMGLGSFQRNLPSRACNNYVPVMHLTTSMQWQKLQMSYIDPSSSQQA